MSKLADPKSTRNFVDAMIARARKLSVNLNDLLKKSTTLLIESQIVDKNLFDCCGVQDDQLLKNLVKYCNNEERINELLENAELKQSVEDYKAGVQFIMAKYKQHCEGDLLNERYNLRSKYIGQLQNVVNGLDMRIEEMQRIMVLAVGLGEQESSENQRMIQQLSKENELMRRQLQISIDPFDMDCFRAASESGTQIEPGDAASMITDSVSLHSFDYLTCSSSTGGEWVSPANSTISDEEVNAFIAEALAETIDKDNKEDQKDEMENQKNEEEVTEENE